MKKPRLAPDPRRVDAAFAHLESVRLVVLARRIAGQCSRARVIPFPPRQAGRVQA